MSSFSSSRTLASYSDFVSSFSYFVRSSYQLLHLYSSSKLLALSILLERPFLLWLIWWQREHVIVLNLLITWGAYSSRSVVRWYFIDVPIFLLIGGSNISTFAYWLQLHCGERFDNVVVFSKVFLHSVVFMAKKFQIFSFMHDCLCCMFPRNPKYFSPIASVRPISHVNYIMVLTFKHFKIISLPGNSSTWLNSVIILLILFL